MNFKLYTFIIITYNISLLFKLQDYNNNNYYYIINFTRYIYIITDIPFILIFNIIQKLIFIKTFYFNSAN